MSFFTFFPLHHFMIAGSPLRSDTPLTLSRSMGSTHRWEMSAFQASVIHDVHDFSFALTSPRTPPLVAEAFSRRRLTPPLVAEAFSRRRLTFLLSYQSPAYSKLTLLLNRR